MERLGVRARRGRAAGRPRREFLPEDYVRVLEQRGVVESYGLLRNREREILQPLTEGKTNKAVATMLNISRYTVEAHRSHILQKPNLHNSAELVLFAVGKSILS